MSLPTSPASVAGYRETWSPPNSRSSLDPNAPEFRTSIPLDGVRLDTPVDEIDTPKRAARFALTKLGGSRPGDSFLNNFTGLFRREAKIGEEEMDPDMLVRPKSQDSVGEGQASQDDDAPKKKKKKEWAKGKGLWRRESKSAITEEGELSTAKSLESLNGEEEEEESPKRKKKRGKKGVKFVREEVETGVEGQDGVYYQGYEGEDVAGNGVIT
jgi:hypothetical protein